MSRKRRRKRLTAAGLFSLATILVGAMIVALIIAGRRNPRLDPDTLCRVDGRIPEHWVVVLDMTDAYSAQQRVSVQNEFASIKNEVPRFARLSLYSVPEKPEDALEPLVTLCNPGSGEGESRFTGNPEWMRYKWETEFELPIQAQLDELFREASLRASPIMGTIQAVNLRAFGGDNADAGSARRLFLVSDMLEHTTEYSHYGAGPPRFEELSSTPYYRRVFTDLSNVDVTIFYVRRDDPAAAGVQGRSHIDFWDAYIESLGGRIIHVKRIEG